MTWFLGLGENYGVNPWIFGVIYVGAIPVFTYFVTRIVQNARAHRSILAPSLGAGVCFVSAYVYLIIVGNNVPTWVYWCIGLLVIVGARSTYQKITHKIHEDE